MVLKSMSHFTSAGSYVFWKTKKKPTSNIKREKERGRSKKGGKRKEKEKFVN